MHTIRGASDGKNARRRCAHFSCASARKLAGPRAGIRPVPVWPIPAPHHLSPRHPPSPSDRDDDRFASTHYGTLLLLPRRGVIPLTGLPPPPPPLLLPSIDRPLLPGASCSRGNFSRIRGRSPLPVKIRVVLQLMRQWQWFLSGSCGRRLPNKILSQPTQSSTPILGLRRDRDSSFFIPIHEDPTNSVLPY